MKNFFSLYARFVYPAAILIISLMVYFPFYGSPQSVFWDENYHVPSAQKHIDGVMYMEAHPPLGKMLIALGEVVFGGNEKIDKHKLIETDYITETPPEMSFKGFRWPSVMMMAMSAVFFFGIINCITQKSWLAASFTSLVIFDNALVVHARAAQLDGIQIFFLLGAIYYFVHSATQFLYHQKKIKLRQYAILGIIIGLATAVKVTALILLLLFVMLFGIDQWASIKKWDWKKLIKRLLLAAPLGAATVALIFLTVFYVHIGMGKKIIQNQVYKASPEYLNQVRMGDTWSLTTFSLGMRDNWKYMSEYADGVPRLDLCKPDENGSHAIGWPLSKNTISYRWAKDTVDGKSVAHHQNLIGNPIVWFSILGGIILSVCLIVGRFIYGFQIKDEKLFYWICAFTGLYLFYMVAIMQIERVMYLYHYFIPLLFGAINLPLIFNYIYRDEVLANNKHTIINAALFALLVIAVFAFFSPLTYGIGLTEDEFQMRNWFAFWKLKGAQ